MSIQEVFPNPTVKKVIFQVKYPNLFYLESKIGEFQIGIMEKFPKSTLLIKKQFVIAEVMPDEKIDKIPTAEDSVAKKIWRFESDKNVILNMLSDSIDISSEHHKTYDLDGSEKFRDVIQFVINKFLSIIPIPIFSRIGLRYMDECPVPEVDNAKFKEFYNTTLPLERFSLPESQLMQFSGIVKRKEFSLRYVEEYRPTVNGNKLLLDFDGSATNIVASDYLETTDKLHDLIRKEYENSIKDPVYEIMRKKE